MGALAKVSIVRQSFLILSLKWGLLPLNLLISVLIARTLGPEGLGILAVLVASAAVLISVGSFGLPDSFIYYYKKRIYPLGQIVTIPLFTIILFALITFLAIPLFSDQFIRIFFRNLENYSIDPAWIYLAFFVIPLALIIDILTRVLIVDNKMGLYAIQQIGNNVSNLAFILLLVFVLRLSITGVLLSKLFFYIASLVVLKIWLGSHKLNLEFSKNVFLNLFRTGRRQYGISLLALIPKRVDVFLIGVFLSVQYNGYYAITFALMNLLYDIPRATMWPLVGNMTCKNRHEQAMTTAQAIRVLLFLTALAIIIIGLSSYHLILFLYGRKFLLSVSAFKCILPAVIAGAVNIPAAAYYNSIGQPGRIFPYACLSMILHISLDIILIPLIGIRGAAIAFSTSQIFVATTYIFLLSKQSRLPKKEFLIFSREDAKLIHKLIKRTIQKKAEIQIEWPKIVS